MQCDKCGTELGNQPYCTSNLCLTKQVLRVEKNPRGGFLTYFEGSKYPLPAFPRQEILGYVDTLKRVLIGGMRFISSVPLTPHRLIIGIKVLLGDIYHTDKTQHPDRFLKEDYSQSSKEVLRALIASEPTEYIEWCYYLVAIWDTDLAYGLRGKDIFQLLHKGDLRKNPKREIMRLVDILIERENTGYGGQMPKVKMIKRLLRFSLCIKEIRQQIVRFFEELDLDEMKFSLYERYWLANKFDYNYEGKTYEERVKWKREEDRDWVAPKKEKEKPRIAINPLNEAFYNLNRYEAEKMCEETKRLLMEDWKKNQ